MTRGDELMPLLDAFEHAPVRLKLGADVRKYAVNSKPRTIFPGLLCPLSHLIILAQDGVGRGSVAIPQEMRGLTVILKHRRAAPYPMSRWEWRR
jgi:hypothetical protein